MKNVLTFILILQIGVLSAQKNQSELIIGTWRFEKECDLRTEKEKTTSVKEIVERVETENGTGYADRTFKKNNEFEFYYNPNQTDYGKYVIQNKKLIIERRISKEQAEQKPNAIKWHLKRNLIKKKDDGFYYYKPLELDLKSISKNQIMFGNEKYYTIWRRIK